MACPLCECTPEEHEKVWCAYAARLQLRDAWRMAMRGVPALSEGELTKEQLAEHLLQHHWVQPSPPGKFHRSLALQEALSSFPRHLFWLLRAVYRAGALSERQLFAMFYLHGAPDGPELRQQLQHDLTHLTFRSFLYRHWPENRGALQCADPGPYYFINRQAIPIVERLEGVSLEFDTYTTALVQVKEFQLEHDARMNDLVVALRERLYDRVFPWQNENMVAMLGIEHWYSPVQLETHLHLQSGEEINFSPSALCGLRLESHSSRLSSLLPLWLEYDRGTEDPIEVAKGLTHYAAYYASPEYLQKFPRLAEHRLPGPLIVISESPYRRDRIAEAFGTLLGERRVPVYFSDHQSFCQDPYADGMLYPAGEPLTSFSLLERLLHHCAPLVSQRVFAGTDRLTDRSAREMLARNEEPTTAAELGVDLSVWGPPATAED